MGLFDGERIATSRLEELTAAERRLQELEPWLPDAQRMAETYNDLSQRSITDPTITATTLYTEAVQTVERQRREAVVAGLAGQIATRHGAEIEARIREEEGPAIIADEEERFLAANRDRLEATTATRVDRELRRQTRDRLNATYPEQVEQEFTEAHGDRIIAEEKERFMREEAPGIRERVERTTYGSLTQRERQRLREEAEAAGKEAAFNRATAEEIMRLRLERMVDMGKRTSQIPLSQFEHGDVVTVQLCPENISYDKGEQAAVSRTLRLSVIDPTDGVVKVMDDSWRGSAEPALTGLSFGSGTLLTLQAAAELAKPDDKRETPTLMRSIPLAVTHDGTDATGSGYELHRVKLQTANGDKTILGPEDRRSSW